MKIYAAAPIDYADPARHSGSFAHRQDLPTGAFVYCPACARVPGELLGDTMSRNMAELYSAQRVVVTFDGQPTFGVPIEAWAFYTRNGPFRLCLIHPGPRGLFVQYMAERGVTVVATQEEALEWLA